MFRPLIALLHRSGLFPYLRDQWRADDASAKQAIKEFATREARSLTGSMQGTIDDLRLEQARAQRDTRSSVTGLDSRIDELAHDVRRLSAILAVNSEHREHRHENALDVARVAAHVSKAVAEGALYTDPAAHIVIENAVPADTYAALLDALPPEPCFTQRDQIKQNFRYRDGMVLPEFTVRGWEFFEQQIVDQMLLPALVERFRPYIGPAYDDKYGADAAAIRALPLAATAGRLMLRRPGYHLDPHLDPRRVIVTCLVYFARPKDDQQFGTQFFRIDDVPAVNRSNTYYPEANGYQCELIRTVPFKPNTVIAFLNHNVAHGADIPQSAPKGTRRYAYQFYVSPKPEDVAAIVGGPADEE